MSFADGYVQDWNDAQESFRRVQKLVPTAAGTSNGWERPPEGWMKCNVDGAISADKERSSFGILVPDPLAILSKACLDRWMSIREA